MGATIDRQIRVLQEAMAGRPKNLFRHARRVAMEASELAERWDVDPKRAELAAWGHDLFRAHGGDELRDLAVRHGVPIGHVEMVNPVFLHGPVAAVVLAGEYGIDDQEVLGAVRDHTTGRAGMPMLAKVLLIADKVERRKRERRPAMRLVRKAARKRSLDIALLSWADWMLVEEREHGWVTHPQHWEARERWVADHHAGEAKRSVAALVRSQRGAQAGNGRGGEPARS